jgi:phosphoserine aminotransferase
VRDDLLGRAMPNTPEVFNYQVQAEADSMINTPPTYAVYIAGLVFQWLKQQGGLAAMEKQNMAKAQLLYDYLDQSEFYQSPVAKQDRSRMNVPFRLKSESLDDAFLKSARAANLVELKGHRSVGGMRASIYNAMPLAGVQALVSFMRDFEQRQG